MAYFLGAKRKIGFWFSLFFCLFLTPIGGIIAILASKKLDTPSPAPSKAKSIVGWVLVVFFGLSLIVATKSIGIFDPVIDQNYGGDEGIKRLMNEQLYGQIVGNIGFVGLGIYLILRGKNQGR